MDTFSKYIFLIITVWVVKSPLVYSQITPQDKSDTNTTNQDKLEVIFRITPMSTSLKVDGFESNTSRKAGYNIGADLFYRFKQYNNRFNLGFSVGFSFSQYQSQISLDYADSVWTTDADNEQILLYEYASGLNETHKIKLFEIPVLFQVSYKLSPKIFAYGNIGPCFSFITNSRFTNSMTLTRAAYYPGLNVLLHDVDVEGSPYYYPTNKSVKGSGSLSTKGNIGLQVGGGIKYQINPAVSLLAGLNYYQGLTNILKSNPSVYTLADNSENINSLINKSSKTQINAIGIQLGISVSPSELLRKKKARPVIVEEKQEIPEVDFIDPLEIMVQDTIKNEPEVIVVKQPETVLSGKIAVKESAVNPVGVRIDFARNNKLVDSVYTEPGTGDFKTALTPGKYIVGVTSENCIPIVEQIEVTNSDSIRLPYLELNKNITFQPDLEEPTKESYTLLNKICISLVENPSVKIEVRGHTDGSGKKELNDLLSKKRADSIVRYMIGKGVSPEQLKAVGCGSVFPVADNTTEMGRCQNRRVEIKVIEY